MPPKKTTVPTKGGAKESKPTTSNSTTKSTKLKPKPKAANPNGPKKGNSVSRKITSNGSKESNTSVQSSKKMEPTKEDIAATKIQALVRGFLARQLVKKKKQEEKDNEEKMNRMEKEAYLYVVKMYQEEAEREREKEEKERRRRKLFNTRKKAMLEAAFDGEIDEILNILKAVEDDDIKSGLGNDLVGKATKQKHQLEMVDCEDANGNTPLSEAGGGGNVDVIKLLIRRGANINTQGQFQRTPLYRAAFAGHLDAVQTLLEYGADPRMYAADGQSPEHVASNSGVKHVLENWNIETTLQMLEKIEIERERRLEEQKQRQAIEMERFDNKIAALEKEFKTRQQQLCNLECQLEKRIYEHDSAPAMGFDKPEITLQAIKDVEAEVEILKMETEKASQKLAIARLERREQQAKDSNEEKPGITVMLRELDDVLLKDVGNKIKDSGKWPLLIDTTQQAATFLRYRDTNYLNVLDISNMQGDRLRLALLGALRFGKPLVIDMMQIDMFDQVSMRFDDIMHGLLQSIMDGSILKPEKYEQLIKKEDGDIYEKNKFLEGITANFKLFLITQNSFPPQELIDQTYPLRIIVPDK